MGSTKEQKVLRAVLEMYKNMPFLWKKDHEDYSNKEVREEGYKALLEKYQDFDDTATMRVMKKRIENLRTSYLKEWKKVQASQKAEDGEVYVPCLWYFKLLDSFLHNRNESSEEPSENGFIKSEPGNSIIKTESRPKRKITRPSYTGLSTESAKKIFTEINPKKEEAWEAYGKCLGFEVKDIEGPQLVICKKIIADAIFYAKLNKLNENSQIVNPEMELPEFDAVEYLESD